MSPRVGCRLGYSEPRLGTVGEVPSVLLERYSLFPELPLPHSCSDWDLGLLCRVIVLFRQYHRPGLSIP
ncbi:hypothetical protein DPEC_G00340630 [Dallia pectoralis]|uniref:Uncharacterized protein n=1 Tax=Dallia pectoralis TaxID=75939 RepID=A0ACC2F558_DALPE|nr:hypothetical protein DPEC_G00340630 [Dallia pectoralis]